VFPIEIDSSCGSGWTAASPQCSCSMGQGPTLICWSATGNSCQFSDYGHTFHSFISFPNYSIYLEGPVRNKGAEPRPCCLQQLRPASPGAFSVQLSDISRKFWIDPRASVQLAMPSKPPKGGLLYGLFVMLCSLCEDEHDPWEWESVLLIAVASGMSGPTCSRLHKDHKKDQGCQLQLEIKE